MVRWCHKADNSDIVDLFPLLSAPSTSLPSSPTLHTSLSSCHTSSPSLNLPSPSHLSLIPPFRSSLTPRTPPLPPHSHPLTSPPPHTSLSSSHTSPSLTPPSPPPHTSTPIPHTSTPLLPHTTPSPLTPTDLSSSISVDLLGVKDGLFDALLISEHHHPHSGWAEDGHTQTSRMQKVTCMTLRISARGKTTMKGLTLASEGSGLEL